MNLMEERNSRVFKHEVMELFDLKRLFGYTSFFFFYTTCIAIAQLAIENHELYNKREL